MTPRAWLGVALFCSLAPLALGVTIFLLWLPTHWVFLAAGGLLNILLGTCLFPVGLLATRIYARKARDEDPWMKRKAALAVALLIVNFSTAATIMVAAKRLGSECAVVLDNKSGRVIESFAVSAGFPAGTVTSIPPGARRTLRFRALGDCSVRYTLSLEGTTQDGEITGWTDQGMGGDWSVTLHSDGRVRVKNLRHPFE